MRASKPRPLPTAPVDKTLRPQPVCHHLDLAYALLALLPPLLAFLLQWTFWDFIKPYVWFLHFPAVIVSCWLTGRNGGFMATALSLTLAWWFFVPPEHALLKNDVKHLIPAIVFVGIGILFSLTNDRLRPMTEKAVESNLRILTLYEKNKILREEWTSVIAHDLLQPVSVIAMASDSLKEEEKTLSEDGLQTLNIIASNARRLDRLIRDFSDVSQIEMQKLHVNRQNVDMVALLGKAVTTFRKLNPSREVRCHRETGTACIASVDAHRIEQVLDNLFSNAVKYSEPNTPIEVGFECVRDEFLFSITNVGKGLSQEQTDRLFDRFYRAPGVGKFCHGMGLGLYISRGLIESHGGKIWVECLPDQRITFKFSIPAKSSLSPHLNVA